MIVSLSERDEALRGKFVCVIGGTGSFGRYMVQELLKTPVMGIIIFSRDEEKQLDMQREFDDERLYYEIGDVRDYERLVEVLENVDIVYHAAALKIIPVCEKHPMESIKTNLEGTINVKEACMDAGVKKAIFISTDKAVKPVNVYGMCKAIAERYWIRTARDCSCNFVVVRYGNVIRSRGSVIPYFEDLISEGEMVPITDPKMTRFLLRIEDAVDLVFYATCYGQYGRIYVPKVHSCNIFDLARALGAEPEQVDVVGIRPGEKIHEILISEEEIERTKDKEKFIIVTQEPQTKEDQFPIEYSSKDYCLTVSQIRRLIK